MAKPERRMKMNDILMNKAAKIVALMNDEKISFPELIACGEVLLIKELADERGFVEARNDAFVLYRDRDDAEYVFVIVDEIIAEM